MNITTLLSKLSSARMEYESLSQSVLERFVVPFKIDQLDLRNQNLSIALVGSRGSGKSTFIQYFSHSTRFDPGLKSVDESEFDCIVLYWKPDIAYCQGLNESWLGEEVSERFFMNHASLEIIDEVLKMITNIKHHFPEYLAKVSYGDSNVLHALKKISNNEIQDIESADKWLEDQRFELSTRLNPVNLEGMPALEPHVTLTYLLRALERDCEIFKSTHFKIFVDEFELLGEAQQRLINGYRKSSSAKLNWNVAYKLFAEITNETKSNQPLQEPDDYLTEVLDYQIKENFELYAAEIFLLSIRSSGIDCSSTMIDPEVLGNRYKIADRMRADYKESVIGAVKRLLPTPSRKDLSGKEYLSHDWLRGRVERIVVDQNRDESLVDQIMADPSMAVTIVGTSKQKSFDLDSFLSGTSAAKEKINTFELNSLLTFRNKNSNLDIPLYSGFDRFIAMTSPNVRHFKVLCFNSLKQLDEDSKNRPLTTFEELPEISPKKMDLAAVSTSKHLVNEINSYPPYGHKLYRLVNRIGELFKASQNSYYQTEPERVVFFIKHDYANSEPELESILSSGEAWKVFIADDHKRRKSDNQYAVKEYTLNPIYAPKFTISYRKKRDISIDLDEFKLIVNGSSEEFESIRNKYRKKWKSDSDLIDDNSNDQIKDQGSMF